MPDPRPATPADTAHAAEAPGFAAGPAPVRMAHRPATAEGSTA
ncbi:hypothetical protein ACIGFK_36985 [Streptomyces sp. NPDC085524]